MSSFRNAFSERLIFGWSFPEIHVAEGGVAFEDAEEGGEFVEVVLAEEAAERFEELVAGGAGGAEAEGFGGDAGGREGFVGGEDGVAGELEKGECDEEEGWKAEEEKEEGGEAFEEGDFGARNQDVVLSFGFGPEGSGGRSWERLACAERMGVSRAKARTPNLFPAIDFRGHGD